jgi:hypothetical protein
METEETVKCEVEPQPSCRNIIGFCKDVLGVYTRLIVVQVAYQVKK